MNKSKRPDNWSTFLKWHTPGSINSKEPGINGILNNNIQNIKHYTSFPTSNYLTSLDSQVKELGSSHEHATHKYVTPSLGDSNSAVFDTGTTSSGGRTREIFYPTTKISYKTFHMPTSETTAANTQAELFHDVREPAKTVDVVTQLQHNSLISGGKSADVNYITVLTPTEVLIYDGKDTHISVYNKPTLKCWRYTITGLWRVPLQPPAPTTKHEGIAHNKTRDYTIANVYELPSSEKTIRYLDACTGLPTNKYWLKAIKGGNYATWPNLSTEVVNQHFP